MDWKTEATLYTRFKKISTDITLKNIFGSYNYGIIKKLNCEIEMNKIFNDLDLQHKKILSKSWEKEEFDYYKKFIPTLDNELKNNYENKWDIFTQIANCTDNNILDNIIGILIHDENIPFTVYSDTTNAIYKNLTKYKNKYITLNILELLENGMNQKDTEHWLFLIREVPIINQKHYNFVKNCLSSKSTSIVSSAICILKHSDDVYKDVVKKLFKKLYYKSKKLKLFPYLLISDFCDYFEKHIDDDTFNNISELMEHISEINCINIREQTEILFRNLFYENKKEFLLEIEYNKEIYYFQIPISQRYNTFIKKVSKTLNIDPIIFAEYIDEEIDNLKKINYHMVNCSFYENEGFNSHNVYTYLKHLSEIEIYDNTKAIDRLPFQYNNATKNFIHKLYINRKFELLR